MPETAAAGRAAVQDQCQESLELSRRNAYITKVLNLKRVWWGLQYDFAGRYDLPRFVQLVHEAGLFLNLRIGPYVCAEWNSGYVLES